MLHHIGIDPHNPRIVDLYSRFLHGIQISRIAHMSLSVIQFKNTPYFPMPSFDQVFDRLPSRHPVIQRNMRNRKLRVKTVDENNRNPPLLQFLVQRKVGIGQPAFCRLHDNPRHPVTVQDIFQNRLFTAKAVICKSNLDGISFFKQYLFNPLYRFREYISIHISSDYCDPRFILQVFLAYIADISPASPLPHQNALFFQNADGMADRLPAYMKHLFQPVFRIHPLPRKKFLRLNLFPYPIYQFYILRLFFFHYPLSFYGNKTIC